MRITKSTKTTIQASKSDELNKTTDVKASKWISRGGLGYECSNCGYISDFGTPDFCPKCESDMRTSSIKASKKLSANDQALQHIKAAIDILGKSGNKDDITKDSIANLATVMFDIKSQE